MRFGQVLQNHGIRGSQFPTAKQRMSDQQAIEWIASPIKVERVREPSSGGRLVDEPSFVGEKVLNPGVVLEAQTPRFDEKL
jgi:hypothetical protein